MLYDILATLWEGPHDLSGLVTAVGTRTEETVAPAVLDGHVWLLFQLGFIDAHADETTATPRYALTPRGSDFLAASAAHLETYEPKGSRRNHHVPL
ncbi:MAG TPA: hypothetical protein VNF68_00335 [Candidatus Baltobacteraceae bacterium]|nr:hypothetical protein [Candidatus Baltobacteraceae bacterium]